MHPLILTLMQSTAFKGKAYFDGSGDYLTLLDTDDWYPGSGEFCIETFINFISLPTTTNYAMIFTQRQGTTSEQYFGVYNNAGTYSLRYGNYSGTISCFNNYAFSTGVDYHLALAKVSGVYRMFVNGSQIGSDYTNGVYVSNVANPLYLFGYNKNGTPGWFANCYSKGVRYTNGSGRYSTTFTPPSVFSVDSANVKLCMNFSEYLGATTFIDDTGKSVDTIGNAIIVE